MAKELIIPATKRVSITEMVYSTMHEYFYGTHPLDLDAQDRILTELLRYLRNMRDEDARYLVLEVPITLRPTYMNLVRETAPKGGYLYAKITKPKRGRSTGKHSQCNHFNGHVRFIAEETGQDFDSVKLFIKVKAMDRGYPGAIIGDVKIPISEADATVDNATLLIDTIHQWAAEWGMVLPEENWDEQEGA